MSASTCFYTLKSARLLPICLLLSTKSEHIVRNLTSIEMKRLTGTDDPVKQIKACEQLSIRTYPRNPTGQLLIECVVYETDARAVLSDKEWELVEDENIESLKFWMAHNR